MLNKAKVICLTLAVVICVSLQSYAQKKVWTIDLATAINLSPNGVATDAKSVFTTWESSGIGTIASYTTTNGDTLWGPKTFSRAFNLDIGGVSTNGQLFAILWDSLDIGKLAVFENQTGNTVWGPITLYTGPLPTKIGVPLANGSTIIATWNAANTALIAAYDIQTGNPLWGPDTLGSSKNTVLGNLATNSSLVFASWNDEGIAKIRAYTIATGNKVWGPVAIDSSITQLGGLAANGTMLLSGNVFVFWDNQNNGFISAYDASNGSKRWGPTFITRANNLKTGGITARNGRVVASWNANNQGKLAAFDAPTGNTIWGPITFAPQSTNLTFGGLASDFTNVYVLWNELNTGKLAAYTIGLATEVHNNIKTPTDFIVHQNYPNPFNPYTKIQIELPHNSKITFNVFDSAGRKVRTIAYGEYPPGTYSFDWDGKNEMLTNVASGIYLATLTTPTDQITIKMLLIR